MALISTSSYSSNYYVMLGLVVGCIPFVALATWIYFYVYDHNIIRIFTGNVGVRRNQINTYMETNVCIPYHVSLNRINVDENDDDDHKKPHISISNPLKSYGSRADNVVGLIFSITIALGIELILLMMCELVDYFNASVRLTLFKLIIDSLMILLTLVQPFLIISLLVNSKLTFKISKDDFAKALTTIGCFLGWLFFLHKCGDLSQSFKPPRPGSYNPDTRSIIDRKINEVSIAGITILSILSGIGCTSTPYKLFALDVKLADLMKSGLKSPYPGSDKEAQVVTESEINRLISSYNNTDNLLSKRKSSLNDLLVAKSGTIYNYQSQSSDNLLRPTRPFGGLGLHSSSSNLMLSKNKFGGIMHKVQSFANLSSLTKGSSEDSEERELNMEIESLQQLKNNIYDDLLKTLSKFIEQQQLSQHKQKQRQQQRSHTFNQVLRWCNNAFAIYCIYRVINVVLIRMPYLIFSTSPVDSQVRDTNIIVDSDHSSEHTNTSNDALAITLAKLILSIFPSIPVSETQLINQVGFILSGSLFICSFSNVVITFKSLTRFLLPSKKMENYIKIWLKHLIIAELLGVYIIATALLIRTNLPSNLSHQISKILSLSGSNIISSENSMKEVEFIDAWFDKVFAISCIVTFASIVIKKRFFDVNTEDYYDEEMYIESPQKFA